MMMEMTMKKHRNRAHKMCAEAPTEELKERLAGTWTDVMIESALPQKVLFIHTGL